MSHADTETLNEGEPHEFELQKLVLRVLQGPDAGMGVEAVDGRITVGTAEGATLRLTDSSVSRYHLECEVQANALVVRDLGSRNGTFLHGIQVREVLLRAAVELQLGRTRIALQPSDDLVRIPLTQSKTFGRLQGASTAMRRVFTMLERAAASTAPVLLTGESGTGKELAARALHEGGPRRDGPLEVVDCAGLPPTLAESELFGHEKGAFPGATSERMGAFERAHGGTLFLDELGALPLELQPKFLRALGEGEVRRVGANQARKVDVRVVAATNRDLRREINDGRFRADLFYRLAVVQVRMPPLRERLEDLPLLVPALLEGIAQERRTEHKLAVDDGLWDSLSGHRWPGNVRELRNYLEQLLVLAAAPTEPPPRGDDEDEPAPPFDGLADMPLREAKATLMEHFEKLYVSTLLKASGGNVAEAARRAGVDRVTLFRTIRRYGLRVRAEE